MRLCQPWIVLIKRGAACGRWQYAGHNALNMSELMAGGKTIGINAHYVIGVDDDGASLGYPPLHVHHVHLVPSKTWLRYQWPTTATTFAEWFSRMRSPNGMR